MFLAKNEQVFGIRTKPDDCGATHLIWQISKKKQTKNLSLGLDFLLLYKINMLSKRKMFFIIFFTLFIPFLKISDLYIPVIVNCAISILTALDPADILDKFAFK